MIPSLTDVLCTRCGLCCDGSLFADVELAGDDEATALEVMGLEIEDADGDDGALLLQPCRALKGKRCGIYPHRPECCRTFECRLLQEVRRGALGVEQAKETIAEALKRIKRVNELIVQLGEGNEGLPLKERCADALALSVDAATDSAVNRKRAELQVAMNSVESLVQETFLAPPAKKGSD
ncbi:MAG: YkgJ family cysteine cluster protein [Pedosphaera sp.]|nr:YkgJ family cysteine cluster protein [Pedosphaera sp.]